VTIGLLLTAFILGLRHGIDWDHVAAVADLSSSAESRRRGFVLSFIYAVGHAAVVLILGAVAIALGASIPASLDAWAGRVVGVTLVGLGGWILVELARKGRDFRLRSRWILILHGTFAGFRRVRDARARRRVSVGHDHVHEHGDGGHGDGNPHDHAHLDVDDEARAPVVLGVSGGQPGHGVVDQVEGRDHAAIGGIGGRLHGLRHRHRHHHDLSLGERSTTPGNGTAAGIGVLHGIGIESPTQIAVFVASTSVVGAAAGFALLGAWVVGLIVANSVMALLAGFGLLHAERHFVVYATTAVLVGVASVIMGSLLLVGFDALPEL